MLDILLDSLIDCLKMLPWIIGTYILLAVIENKTKLFKDGKFLSSRMSPLFGSLAGAFPQCGISVMSAKLYDSGLIKLGTVLAVFISTSDEAFTILLSSAKRLDLIPLLIIKICLGCLVGFIVNIFSKKKRVMYQGNKNVYSPVIGCKCCQGSSDPNLHWAKRYILYPLKHSGQTILYIFIVTFVFGIFFAEEGIIGAEKFEVFLSKFTYFDSFIAAVVGLIPNCASSAILTSAYLNDVISFGALVGGLCTNAGVGLAVLFKNTKEIKRNILILCLLYLIGSVSGTLITLFMIIFGL